MSRRASDAFREAGSRVVKANSGVVDPRRVRSRREALPVVWLDYVTGRRARRLAKQMPDVMMRGGIFYDDAWYPALAAADLDLPDTRVFVDGDNILVLVYERWLIKPQGQANWSLGSGGVHGSLGTCCCRPTKTKRWTVAHHGLPPGCTRALRSSPR